VRVALAFVFFQAGWFAAILGAANGAAWLGPLVIGALAAWFVWSGESRGRSAALLLASGALGFALDTALTAAGMLRFPADGSPGLSTPWMVALWVNFAIFIPGGLRWLYGRYALAASLGAAGGPAAYWAGQRLGAIEWNMPQAAFAVAAEWAAATPAILWLASRREARGGRI